MKYKKRSIFVNGVTIASAGLACYLFRDYIIPARQPFTLDVLLDCLGLTLALCGQNIRIMARGYKSLCHRNKPVLINTGIYGLVRNPMYLGSYLIGLGLSITLLSLMATIFYTVAFLSWYAWQIHHEQIFLRDKFGQPYVDYCKITPCLFPKPSDIRSLLLFRPEGFNFNWITKEWNTISVWTLTLLISEGRIDSIVYHPHKAITEFAFLFFITVIFCSFITTYGLAELKKD